MAAVWINGTSYQVDLIVFDKDGTLIDFDHLWGHKTEASVERLLAEARCQDEALRQALYRNLGYDAAGGKTAGNSPLAIAPNATLNVIAAVTLYQHGFGWEEASRYVAASFAASMSEPPGQGFIRPLGQVESLFRQLRQAGIATAVVTSDERAPTEASLAMLGITPYLNVLICSDDGFPPKPAPDALWHICTTLRLEPGRTMMVGDASTDMIFGQNAGIGCRLAVLSGPNNAEALRLHADELVTSIDDIHLLPAPSPPDIDEGSAGL